MSKENTNKKSGGILSGLLLLVVGIGILWYNEGRTVKNQGAINEARKNYIDVSSKEIESKNDGKLVATNGKLDLSEAATLVDETFGVKADSALMERKVEMYQWKEECETDDNNNKKCSYKKEWSDDVIDSSEFNDSKHTNPGSMPYDSEKYVAENVKMGAFTLPKDLLEKLSTKKEKKNADLTTEYTNPVEGYEVSGNYITTVKEGETPEIGDVRISFSYNDATSVSVLAVQNDESFVKYTTKSGTSVYRIKEGTHNGQEIIQDMTDENTTIKWLLRLLGVLLEVLGIAAILSPIKKLASFVPFLGGLVGAATGLIALLGGLAISLVVIAVAWLRFRPILSICLIAIVVVLVAILIMLKKKKPEEKQPAEAIINGN